MGHGPGRTARAVLDALATHPCEMTITELATAVSGSHRGIRAVVARLESRGLVRVNRDTAVRVRDDGRPVYGLWVSLPPAEDASRR